MKHHISNSNLQNSVRDGGTPIPNSSQVNGGLAIPNGLGSRITSRRPSVISSNSTPSDSMPNSLTNSLNNSFLGVPGSLKEIASIEENGFQCNDGVVRDIPVIYIDDPAYMDEKII
jgi:hypothetical protein